MAKKLPVGPAEISIAFFNNKLPSKILQKSTDPLSKKYYFFYLEFMVEYKIFFLKKKVPPQIFFKKTLVQNRQLAFITRQNIAKYTKYYSFREKSL